MVDCKQQQPKILIVEDDVSLRPIWEAIIKRSSKEAQLSWAVTEEEAERAIRKRLSLGEQFNVIIADVFLGGKRNGADLWRRYGTHGCEFILVSVAPLSEVLELLEGTSPPLYLQKPFDLDLCGKALAKALSKEPPPLQTEAIA